jgi:hypothetical protein
MNIENLQSFYNQNNNSPNHIWNSNETRIQVGRQLGAHVLAKCNSHQMYSTISRSKEWMTMKCAINAMGGSLLGFYIFRGEKFRL